MFGLQDAAISLVYLLNILAVLLSVGYGAYNWNRGGDTVLAGEADERKWIQEEEKIEKDFE